MKRKFTREQFLDAWQRHGSATLVSEELDTAIRVIYQYRRKLEAEGIPLPAHNDLRYTNGAPSLVESRLEKARLHTSIESGHVIIFSDAHFWPGIYSTAFRGLIKLIKDLKPKIVVNNGDAFDGSSISRFPRIGWDEMPSVIQELEAVHDHLSEIRAVSGKAKLYWPLGNHDARYENYLANKAPEFRGIKGFHLKDHFPEWEGCWAVWINNDTVVKHRWKGGVYAPRNNTLHGGVNFVTGHLHSLKVFPHTDYSGTRFGVDTGTLADPDGPQFLDYTEDGPKDWRSGFAVLTYHKGRLLWPQLARVIGPNELDYCGQVLTV